MRWLALVTTFLGLTCGRACAHPVSQQHYDRSLLVRVATEEVIVEYGLALDGWTLARDLVPLRMEIQGTDVETLCREYAERFGPKIAEGLVATLDGRELSFRFAGYQVKIEDHFRFTFILRTDVAPKPGLVHEFTLSDSNFDLEPGTFRLGLRSEEAVTTVDCQLPSDPELATPIALHEQQFDLDKRLRTVQVKFTAMAQPTSPEATCPSQSFATPRSSAFMSTWDLLRTGDLQRLLSSRAGLGLVLLLAFVFGAAHALQPGHGKTLVAAYLVGERGTVWHAFFLGLVTTITHVSVVVLLAIVVPLVYPRATSEITFVLSLGCGLLVTLMALWLLLRRLGGQADHVHLFGSHHHHGDGAHHHHLPTEGKVTWWALVTLGISGGLVPCVDALGLLTMTWVTRQLWLGLPLIVAFSAGLASVLVVTGILVVKLKRFASSRWGEGRLSRWLPVASAVATLLLGLWMCQVAIREHRSAESAVVPTPISLRMDP